MELLRLTSEALQELIRLGDSAALAAALEHHQHAEVAQVLQSIPLSDQLVVLRSMDSEQLLGVFEYLEPEEQIEILKRLRQNRAAEVLEDMSPDERADLFLAFPEPMFEKMLALLPSEEKADVSNLTQYAGHTAGGLMTSDFVKVRGAMTVREAIKHFRKNYHDIEMVYYFYVCDDQDVLRGVVSLRQLISSSGSTTIESIMNTRVFSVHPETDQEDVAEELSLYDFYAIPVTDAEHKMLGIVTFDDMMDVMEREATEDQELFAGLTPTSDEGGPMTIWGQVWQRLPWLIVFLLLSSLSQVVIIVFKDSLTADTLLNMALLLSLQSMLMATAGNAGTQSVTLSLEALSSGRRDWSAWRYVMSHEAFIGLLVGAALALVAFVRGMATMVIPVSETGETVSFIKSLCLSVSVAGAVLICVVVSTMLGGVLPFLCKRLRLDPAVISSPFITSLMDVLAITIYILVALMVMQLFPAVL